MTRPFQEKRRRAQVINAPHLEPLRHPHQSVHPYTCPLVFCVGILALRLAVVRLRQVAMVGFVVDDEDAGTRPEPAQQISGTSLA